MNTLQNISALTHRSMLSYNKQHDSRLEAIIDDLTPCLKHRESGRIYDTEVRLFTNADLLQTHGWSFNWSQYFKLQGFEVYKLLIRGQDRIEGLVCLEPQENFIFVHLVESAPWNVGSSEKEFIGVGAHLFSIACKRSFELGFEGYICFEPKTKLFVHYERELKAVSIGRGRMALATQAARELVDIYF